jgi:hypothetical protein
MKSLSVCIALLVAASVTWSQDCDLVVPGGVQATKVQTDELKIKDWKISTPDYVFEKDYQLTSLQEVEEYVSEHKHLPDIPSAGELEEQGMDVAEMNLLLLKKVEELTLHLIEQRKLIEEQQKRITALECNRGNTQQSGKK